jgi:hypothetical protein
MNIPKTHDPLSAQAENQSRAADAEMGKSVRVRHICVTNYERVHGGFVIEFRSQCYCPAKSSVTSISLEIALAPGHWSTSTLKPFRRKVERGANLRDVRPGYNVNCPRFGLWIQCVPDSPPARFQPIPGARRSSLNRVTAVTTRPE